MMRFVGVSLDISDRLGRPVRARWLGHRFSGRRTVSGRMISIFVSSPGDLRDERAVLDEVVRRLAYDPFVSRHAILRAVSWDNPAGAVPLLASEHAQSAIDSMLPRPSECDIVVGIFWSRLGTPLPPVFGAVGDLSCHSGTAWEIEDALTAAVRSDGPDVLIYRKTAPASVPLGAADWQDRADQYARLGTYLANITGRMGDRGPGQIERFDTLEQFRSLVDGHLRRLIDRRLQLRGTGLDTRQSGSAGRRRTRSPYPGLVTFTPVGSDVFFGRDAEVDALVELTQQAPLVVVVGPSGSGKSSLIGAGLVPRLAAAGTGTGGWRTPAIDPVTGVWHGGRITPSGGAGG